MRSRTRPAARGFPAHAGMDPRRWATRSGRSRLPRTRGDGPLGVSGVARFKGASPHTRGWTLPPRQAEHLGPGFPAHAGMDPTRAASAGGATRLPRTRGDGPSGIVAARTRGRASPHTRGWTLVTPMPFYPSRGFPAHAGMDPTPDNSTHRASGLPRTRGDGPRRHGLTARDEEASPHTRGWTRLQPGGLPRRGGFPAHAGMDPSPRAWTARGRRLPRTRGDGPYEGSIRGGSYAASPHTRGWTRFRGSMPSVPRGFPAHAGMDPDGEGPEVPRLGLPRTRGDGPSGWDEVISADKASPHTRGWTRTRTRRRTPRPGFPAHAGMDRAGRPPGPAAPRLPRTRGDGPPTAAPVRPLTRASPHTRGWTLPRAAGVPGGVGFPAHAGMDPQ